jgi:hypothetical protein
VVLYLDQFHAHIIVSFINATLVLSIGETVEEVTDSGFLGTTPTIGCGLIGDDSLLQVYIPAFLSFVFSLLISQFISGLS